MTFDAAEQSSKCGALARGMPVCYRWRQIFGACTAATVEGVSGTLLAKNRRRIHHPWGLATFCSAGLTDKHRMNNAAVLLMHAAPTPKTQPPLLPASAFPHLAPFQERLLSDHGNKSIKQKAIADSLRVAMLVLACNANPQFFSPGTSYALRRASGMASLGSYYLALHAVGRTSR